MRILKIFCLLVISSSCIANDAPMQLQTLLEPINSLIANFNQTVYSPQNQVVQKAKGNLSLQRPNKFHWQVLNPIDQIVLSDGDKVYNYDVDLQQVIVNKLDLAQDVGPLTLLLDKANTLEQKFNIDKASKNCFNLYPKQDSSSFSKICLCFSKQKISSLTVVDKIDQTTEFLFSEVVNNPNINPSQFVLNVPKPIDIVENY